MAIANSILNLPIVKVLGNIVSSVRENQVTIVATPTGSGKTLLVPAILADEHAKVIVTVPRVLLAKQAMNGVNDLVFAKSVAGCITGRYSQKEDARLLFMTEGSLMNRSSLMTSNTVLVVDEVHEQGINTEEVLFLAREHALNGGKVVLMSATIDLTKYKAYYDKHGLSVKIISLPEQERPFVTTVIRSNIEDYCIANTDKTILIGKDGKAEIEEQIKALQKRGYKGRIFSLHGETEEHDEKEALQHKGPKIIVATSVAMSGITFDNLDTVCPPESGKHIKDGVLVRYALSKAEIKQWEGRVGRIKDGTAVYSFDYHFHPENPMPEILRANLKDIVISFAAKGKNLATCDLLNQPREIEVEETQTYLKGIGILHENLHSLTEKGKIIQSFGEGLENGLFIYEGKKLGIEATARKIAELCKLGSPFRKASHGFLRNIANTCQISQKSQHYLFLRCIEEDHNTHTYPGDNSGVIDYCQRNQIFLKGVTSLRKSFKRIDNHYKDTEKVSLEKLQAMFSALLPENIFRFNHNEHIGHVNAVFYSDVMYCTLSPVNTRHGRLAEMSTIIK